MKRRVFGALLVGASVLPAIWFGGPGFAFLIFVLACLALKELKEMFSQKEHQTLDPLSVTITGVLIFGAQTESVRALTAGLAATVVLYAADLVFSKTESLDTLLRPVFGVLYIPFMLSHLVLLRHQGAWAVLIPVLCTWACDVFAYLTGKAFGRHKMAPSISPAKTWEGAAGGFLASCCASVAISQYTNLGTANSLLVGMLLGIGGQVGDLAESALKRRAGVKDAGALIPGHGGILDRFDSLLFNGALAFYAFTFLKGL